MEEFSAATWILLAVAEGVGIWGFWLAGVWQVRCALAPSVGSRVGLPEDAAAMLASGLGWALGLGMRGLAASLGYYLGVLPWLPMLACGLAGAVLAVLCRSQTRFLLPGGALRKATPEAKVGLALFACALLFHLARVPLPWADQDEITAYGFLTKMIAQGWTFPEVVRVWAGSLHFGPKLAESLDAQLYLLAGDTWLVRLGRLANLCAVGLVCTGMLRALGAPLALGWAVAACVLATPELAYLGVSLKVDAVVMLLEVGSLILLALAWLAHLPGGPEAQGADAVARQETTLRCAVLACLLALFAAATRQSGLYAVFLSGTSLLWLAGRSRAPRGLWLRLALLACVGALAGSGYWANWAAFGNPIFPFKAPWPLSEAAYLTTLERYREQLNILGPPGLVQLYLIPHLALGLELRHMPFPPYSDFPHALVRGQSMGWLNPTLLGIYLWPLALRLRPALVLGALFLAQYAFWCLGVHYSRVFLGPSILMAVFCGYLCWAEPGTGQRMEFVVRWTARGILILTLCLLLPLGARWSWQQLNAAPLALLTSQGRSESAAQRLTQLSGLLVMPSQADAALMDAALAPFAKPVVQVASSAGRGMHVFFRRGFFVDGEEFSDAPDAVLLGPDNSAVALPGYGRLLHSSADRAWRLYARDRAAAGAP